MPYGKIGNVKMRKRTTEEKVMKIKTMNRLFAGLLCFAMLFSGVLIPGTLVVARAEGSSGGGYKPACAEKFGLGRDI